MPEQEKAEVKTEGEGSADSVFKAMPFQPKIVLTKWHVKRQGNHEDTVSKGVVDVRDANLDNIPDTTVITLSEYGGKWIIVPKPLTSVSVQDIAKLLGLKTIAISKIEYRLESEGDAFRESVPEGGLYPVSIAFNRENVNAFRRELAEEAHFWTATLHISKKDGGFSPDATKRIVENYNSKLPDEASIRQCIEELWKVAVTGNATASINKVSDMISKVENVRSDLFKVKDLIPSNYRETIRSNLEEVDKILHKAHQRRLT